MTNEQMTWERVREWAVTTTGQVNVNAMGAQVTEEMRVTFRGHGSHDTFWGGSQGRLVNAGPPHPGH
jgi:hypothetical protein